MKDETILEAIGESSRRGELSNGEIARIAGEYRTSVSNVKSLASFYSLDDTKDRICVGLPCFLKRTEGDVGARAGGLREESCLGYCNHAPVSKIGGKYVTQKGDGLEEIEESQEGYITRSRENLKEYRARGGYDSGKVASLLDPSRALNLIEKAELKGMGGAGFSTLLKWKSFRENRVADSYLLVNAHEGEPGTFKDRIIMELRPHELIEGALIAAGSNAISKVVIGIKREYVQAVKSVRLAIDEAMEMLAESKMDFHLPEFVVKEVPGGYVTGEETALMEAIEGRRGEPRLRPPFPTERGLHGKPTLVHNVETLAAIAAISRSGDSRVVKNYCLTGDIAKPGIYASEIGITAKDLIERHGGTNVGQLKAIMLGGLSGGMVPSSLSSDIELSFDAARKAGAGMGTGAVIALSEDRCVVDIARAVSAFFQSESCGKCMPCRYGTAAIGDILCRVAEGKATHGDLERGKETAQLMIDGSICALGQAAGKSVLDLTKNFGAEVEAHLDGHCPAGVCRTRGEER